MTCSETLKHISAYLDDELASSHREQVAAHIAECAECQAYRDDLLRIRQLVRCEGFDELPDGLWPRIEAAARGVGARRDRALQTWSVRAASIAAGFVLYLGAYGGLLLWQVPSPPQRVAEEPRVAEILAEAAASLAGESLGKSRLAWLDQRPENLVLEALLEER